MRLSFSIGIGCALFLAMGGGVLHGCALTGSDDGAPRKLDTGSVRQQDTTSAWSWDDPPWDADGGAGDDGGDGGTCKTCPCTHLKCGCNDTQVVSGCTGDVLETCSEGSHCVDDDDGYARCVTDDSGDCAHHDAGDTWCGFDDSGGQGIYTCENGDEHVSQQCSPNECWLADDDSVSCEESAHPPGSCGTHPEGSTWCDVDPTTGAGAVFGCDDGYAAIHQVCDDTGESCADNGGGAVCSVPDDLPALPCGAHAAGDTWCQAGASIMQCLPTGQAIVTSACASGCGPASDRFDQPEGCYCGSHPAGDVWCDSVQGAPAIVTCDDSGVTVVEVCSTSCGPAPDQPDPNASDYPVACN